MKTTVILAEKPKQAGNYAEVFSKVDKKNGYYEIQDSGVFEGKTFITWGVGHLVGLVEPEQYKKEWGDWNIENLPMFPDEYKYQVSEDVKSQFNVVKKLLKQADEIIIATDPDREGEHIARSIIKECGVENKLMKRFWCNSLTPKPVLEAFRNLKDAHEYEGMYKEAQTRQISDWLIGMNLSRLYTLLLQEQGAYEAFSVGRVQTPALYLIYERKKAIDNFVSKPLFEIAAKVKCKEHEFEAKYKERFHEKKEIQSLFSKHKISESNECIIKTVDKEEEGQKSPLLYSLSNLQTKANKKWKYSPKTVLDAVQSLYDKKLLSYPRTDTVHITENEFAYLVESLNQFKELFSIDVPLNQITAKKRYVNGDKVQEHYAIIPTQTVPKREDIENLPETEKNIYVEVVFNTLAMFADEYKYEETKIVVDLKGLLLTATGKVEIEPGWKQILKEESRNKEAQVLPLVSEGDEATAQMEVKTGKTKPPKMYTEGDLINMMKTCGKELDDEEKEILKGTKGIGTEATRSSIIEEIKKRGYISVEKNKVLLSPKAEVLCRAVEGTLLASPKMTAEWEKKLASIGNGEGSQDNFLRNIERYITKMMNDAPTKVKSEKVKEYISEFKVHLQSNKPKKRKFKRKKKINS